MPKFVEHESASAICGPLDAQREPRELFDGSFDLQRSLREQLINFENAVVRQEYRWPTWVCHVQGRDFTAPLGMTQQQFIDFHRSLRSAGILQPVYTKADHSPNFVLSYTQDQYRALFALTWGYALRPSLTDPNDTIEVLARRVKEKLGESPIARVIHVQQEELSASSVEPVQPVAAVHKDGDKEAMLRTFEGVQNKELQAVLLKFDRCLDELEARHGVLTAGNLRRAIVSRDSGLQWVQLEQRQVRLGEHGVIAGFKAGEENLMDKPIQRDDAYAFRATIYIQEANFEKGAKTPLARLALLTKDALGLDPAAERICVPEVVEKPGETRVSRRESTKNGLASSVLRRNGKVNGYIETPSISVEQEMTGLNNDKPRRNSTVIDGKVARTVESVRQSTKEIVVFQAANSKKSIADEQTDVIIKPSSFIAKAEVEKVSGWDYQRVVRLYLTLKKKLEDKLVDPLGSVDAMLMQQLGIDPVIVERLRNGGDYVRKLAGVRVSMSRSDEEEGLIAPVQLLKEIGYCLNLMKQHKLQTLGDIPYTPPIIRRV
ncbi:hypothetical protein HY468_03245 [Candidatus Roizmanbacteria bacterium]|nr:hypothetical protein [Candidatus Roizmanbacteria bacterium]